MQLLRFVRQQAWQKMKQDYCLIHSSAVYIVKKTSYFSQCQIDWLAGERNQTAVFSIIRYAQLYSETLTWKCHKAIQMFVHFLIMFTKLSWIWSSLAQSLLDKQFLLENWRFTFWVQGCFQGICDWMAGGLIDSLHSYDGNWEVLWVQKLRVSLTLRGHMTKILSDSTVEADSEISFWEIFWWTLFMVVFHILSQGCTIFFKQTCAVENRDKWPLAVQKETYALGLWVRRTGWQGNLSLNPDKGICQEWMALLELGWWLNCDDDNGTNINSIVCF